MTGNEQIKEESKMETIAKKPSPVPPPIKKQQKEKGNAFSKTVKTLFMAVVMCVIVAGAAWNSRELWKDLVRRDAPVPVPYMITATEYVGEGLSKDGATFIAKFKIDVFKEDGWKEIELLPSEVAITDSKIPDGSYLHLADGMYSMLTKEDGEMEVEISFSVAPTEAEGKYSVGFTRVPSVTCMLDASFPEDRLDVTVEGAQSTDSTSTNDVTRVIAALPDDTPIKISWEQALPEIEEGPSKYYSETKTLISIAEGLVIGQTKVDFSILHTPTRELAMTVPEGVGVLEVTGSQIRDWRVTDGKLTVQLEKEMIGPYTLDVKYESSPDMSGGKLVIPVVTGSGVEREKGDIGIVALANLEVKNDKASDAHLIDVKDLSAQIVGMTSQPVLLAYRYVDPKFEVSLDIGRHDDLGVLLTVIERAHFTVMQTFDGKRITRAVYNVKNNRSQFLRLKLPEGADLWSASVAGRSTQPAKDEGGRVLLPLARSQGRGGMSAFPVEIVYAEEGVKPDERGRGTTRVELPYCAQPIMHMMVSLYVPEQGRYRNFDGTLREVEKFTALRGVVQAGNAGAVANMRRAVAQRMPNAVPGTAPIEVNFPMAGKAYLLEKILVVKDPQWFEYDFERLVR